MYVLRGICSNLALVRADVSRLPFASGSIDAVHAGAALHCWPSPSNAVSSFAGFVSFSEFFLSVRIRNHIYLYSKWFRY